MKEIVFRFNTGYQDYLHDCYVLPEGHAPIKLFEDAFFGDVLICLAFLVDPQNPDAMGDTELAKHLLEISRTTNYSFVVKVYDVNEFLNYNSKYLNK